MTHASHQTVRLSQGKHRDPDHGACVMELASMLGGEPFSDRPRCVDPVIAAFLRTYNDGIDDRRRQDLYPLAAEVVGTRTVSGVQAERARMCLQWAQARHSDRRRGARRLLPRRPLLPDGRLGDDAAGTLAGRIAVKQATKRRVSGGHEAAMAFVHELLAVGAAPTPTIEREPRLSPQRS
jgi:hypothetical protein